MNTSFRARSLACALLATTALAAPVFAQSAPPPKFLETDGNGVDLTTGKFHFSLPEGSIGSGEGALVLSRIRAGDGLMRDNWTGAAYPTVQNGVSVHLVDLGPTSDTFTSSFTATKADGGRLELVNGAYRYTARDGSVIRYFPGNPGYPLKNAVCGTDCQLPSSITAPNGTTYQLNWELVEICNSYDWEFNCLDGGTMARLRQITSSTNFRIDINYVTDSTGSSSWYTRTSATFTNLLSPPASLPTVRYAYPTSGVEEITDTGGRVWRIANSSSSFALRRPGSAIDNITATLTTGGVATAVTNHGVTTNYSRTVSGNVATTTITNPLNQQTVVTADVAIGRPLSIRDPLNRTTSFQYDGSGRLTRETAPEGNYIQYSYDGRGNLTQAQHVPKANSGAATITTSATYEAGCSTPACNKPLSTTDARGQTTEYSYDPTHGGVLSITAPAAPNGVRPQTRYGYGLVDGEYQLTAVSKCQTQSSCAGSADEVKTTIAYDANGNVTSLSSGASDGSLTATSSATYDSIGNLLTVDGPLAGSADTVRHRYNAARELVGTVSPDPDAGGALRHRATRNTIDGRGLVTRVESGTVADQSDGAWANFASLDAAEIDYDPNFRPVTQRLVAGGSIQAVSQMSYDGLGREDCTAQRMNPSAFGSLPGACSLGAQGSFGPDRIVKTVYDAAGQVTEVRTAVGTALEAAEVSTTYTLNGKAQTVTDAENNRTTYEYDGHDRLFRTRFPVPTKGALASSSTDYEELGYDAGSNVTSRRVRDGNVIGYSYDNLSRMTFKNLPGAEPDVSYAHDLLGRITSASQSGNALSFSYDALGRNLAQAGPLGTTSYAYDIGGRRIRTSYADGFYVD